MPWRKGPFKFGSIELDTEWRSDLKWDRLNTTINLANHRVLDVGSGSGYYLWRMLELECCRGSWDRSEHFISLSVCGDKKLTWTPKSRVSSGHTRRV